MKELLRTNNVVRLSWAQALLRDAGIDSVVLDHHASLVDGSIGAVPRRLMVAERDHDRSTDVDALEDSFGPRARDERHGLGERRGVPDLLLGETVDAPDRPHDRGRVLEAARRDEAEDRAGAREEGVRRDRAPVGDPPGPPEQLDEVDAEPRSAALERREDAVGRIGGRGRGLCHAHMPGRVQQRDVGERPADVGPDDDRGPQLVLIAGAGPRTP